MKTFLRLLGFSKPYHHYIPEYVVYVLLYIIFGLLNFTMLIPLLDVLFNSNTVVVNKMPDFSFSVSYIKDAFYYYFNTSIQTYGKFGVLVYVTLVLFLCVMLKNLFGFLSQKVLTRMRVNLLRKLRKSLFEKFVNMPLAFFHNEKKGNLLSIISNDVLEIENSVVSSVQTTLREPLVIISTFIMLFYFSKTLTFFTLIFFPVSGFIINSISKKLRKKSNYSQALTGNLLNISDEVISGVRIVKAFNAEKQVSDKFASENDELTRISKKIVNQRELASPTSEVLGVFVIMIIIIYGGSLILSGKSNLTASAFITYIAFYFQIISPAKNIANAVTSLQRGLSAGDRVFRILDTPQTITEKINALVLKSFDNNIQFKNVFFAYGDEPVLKAINIIIPKGKTLALVGESGAGKSTLSDLVSRFYDVTAGEVLIDNVNIKDVNLKSLRSLISIVSQEPILFNDTVLNNILFGAAETNKEAAIEAAKVANAHNFIMELEHGYDTIIGDRGMKLSGGQRQRLTIARAIYKNPPILILDEATSSLDTESERIVQDAINHLMKDRTSIVIAHRLSTVRHADEIVVLQKGEIIQRGTHEQLMQQPGTYKRLVTLQEIK